MNHILASMIAGLNALVAIVIIMVFAALGRGWAISQNTEPLVGVVLGAGVGLVAASLICGALALLVEIRNSLRELVDATRPDSSDARRK